MCQMTPSNPFLYSYLFSIPLTCFTYIIKFILNELVFYIFLLACDHIITKRKRFYIQCIKKGLVHSRTLMKC